MKILTFTENFLVGGLETRILNMDEELRNLGHQTAIYGINVLSHIKSVNKINLPDHKNRLSNRNLQVIESIIDKEQPDFVDIHPFATIELCGLVALNKRIPYSITIHGLPSIEYINSNPLAHKLTAHADHIFCVSVLLLEKIRQKYPNVSSSFCPNGIKMPASYRQYGKPIKKKSLLIVSRLDEYKAVTIKHFIYNFSKTIIAKNLINSIDLVGDGSEMKKLKELANKNNLKINFIGQQSAIELMPKYWLVGGVGRVIIEAASLNIPALILGYGGIGGLVSKNNYQYLTKSNFGFNKSLNPNKIDAQIVDLRKNYNFYQCRDRAKLFNDIKKIAFQYQNMLTKLLITKNKRHKPVLNLGYSIKLWKVIMFYFDMRHLLRRIIKKFLFIPKWVRQYLLLKISELRFQK